MRIEPGTCAAAAKKGERLAVAWDTGKLVNPHVMVSGKSGTGKSWLLRSLAQQMGKQAAPGCRIHIIDAHGDLDVEGASTVRYSESSPWGFNPLEICADPDFGGPRKRIAAFCAALNRTNMRLGPRQEGTMRRLLQDLYAANGFYDGKPETWKAEGTSAGGRPKRFPCPEDAARFAKHKLKALFLGATRGLRQRWRR